MTTLAVRRSGVPFWIGVCAAVVAWLVAWFVAAPLAIWLAFEILPLEPGTPLGEAVAFFLYDVPKVLLLLTTIVFVVAIIRSYFPPERTRKHLSHTRLYAGNVLAAGLGVLTPF